MKIAKLIVLEYTLCILGQIKRKSASIAADNAHKVAPRIELHLVIAPIECLRMQHWLNREIHVGQLEEHLIEQFKADCCNIFKPAINTLIIFRIRNN